MNSCCHGAREHEKHSMLDGIHRSSHWWFLEPKVACHLTAEGKVQRLRRGRLRAAEQSPTWCACRRAHPCRRRRRNGIDVVFPRVEKAISAQPATRNAARARGGSS